VEPREETLAPWARVFFFNCHSEKEEKMAEKNERYEDSDLYRIRHSAAHVMAQAVVEMFPGGQVHHWPPGGGWFLLRF
jgi:threonyl-tRNA synthetase